MAENKPNEQPGEDPEVLADIAKATRDLADLLKLHDIDVDYCEADWKDTEELIEHVHDLIVRYPGWSMHYFSGDTWSIDSNFVFFISNPVPRELAEKIGEYVAMLGAELPGEVIPPKPKCPKCVMEIEYLVGSYAAVVEGRASILNGVLDTQLEEGCKSWEIIDEDSAVWCCPGCGAELFRAGQEAEMTAFLLCDKEYKPEGLE